MRLTITFIILFLTSGITSNALAVSPFSPQLQIAFNNGADQRQWAAKVTDKSHERILIEMAPAGDDFSASVEVLENQVVFTPATLNNYLKIWFLQQTEADPDFKIINTIHGHQDSLVIYLTPANNRITIRKFFKGSDGVYMLAYYTQEKSINYAIYNAWLSNIKTSTLVKNPESSK